MKKTFRIISLGCKVNQYDGQCMREKLRAAGLSEAARGKPAALCVINSCTVTAKADKESLYALRRCRREAPDAVIVATGCMTECSRDAGNGADLILKNKDRPRIVPLLREHFPRLLAGAGEGETGEHISSFQGHSRAFLKIQDGCDNFCSYCRVPFARGRPVSKPLDQAVAEAALLAKNGYKEIVIAGICVGTYGRDLTPPVSLADAIESLAAIPGLRRIRVSSIEAVDVTPRLVGLLKAGGKLCPHLHIPLQSGDDGILTAMSRRYTAAGYLALITRLKRAVPGIGITTDVMVGFPGETEEQFRNTVAVVRRAGFAKVHIFPFSGREGTRAFSLPRVDPLVVQRRCHVLQEEEEKVAARFRAKFIGKRLSVLIERRAPGRPGFWEGYAGNYIRVLARSGKDLLNRETTVVYRERPASAIDTRTFK